LRRLPETRLKALRPHLTPRPPAGRIPRSGSSARLQWRWCPVAPRQALRLGIPLPRTNSPPPEPPGSPANRPASTRTPRPANTVAPLDQRLSCKDVASMFLGCSLVVSSFLLPLFVPYCPRSRPPRHAKTRAVQPGLSPSARAPIQPPGPTPAHGRHCQYRDGSGLVKVTMTF
jgi:hypothetical protein